MAAAIANFRPHSLFSSSTKDINISPLHSSAIAPQLTAQAICDAAFPALALQPTVAKRTCSLPTSSAAIASVSMTSPCTTARAVSAVGASPNLQSTPSYSTYSTSPAFSSLPRSWSSASSLSSISTSASVLMPLASSPALRVSTLYASSSYSDELLSLHKPLKVPFGSVRVQNKQCVNSLAVASVFPSGGDCVNVWLDLPGRERIEIVVDGLTMVPRQPKSQVLPMLSPPSPISPGALSVMSALSTDSSASPASPTPPPAKLDFSPRKSFSITLPPASSPLALTPSMVSVLVVHNGQTFNAMLGGEKEVCVDIPGDGKLLLNNTSCGHSLDILLHASSASSFYHLSFQPLLLPASCRLAPFSLFPADAKTAKPQLKWKERMDKLKAEDECMKHALARRMKEEKERIFFPQWFLLQPDQPADVNQNQAEMNQTAKAHQEEVADEDAPEESDDEEDSMSCSESDNEVEEDSAAKPNNEEEEPTTEDDPLMKNDSPVMVMPIATVSMDPSPQTAANAGVSNAMAVEKEVARQRAVVEEVSPKERSPTGAVESNKTVMDTVEEDIGPKRRSIPSYSSPNSFSPSSSSSSGTPSSNWVQCDSCQKWRRLPSHVCPDSLPRKWFCRMNRWTRYNECSVQQEQEKEEKEERVERRRYYSYQSKQKKTGADVQTMDEEEDIKYEDEEEECSATFSSAGLPMPFHVSRSLSLLSLGYIPTDRPCYHNERYMFPIGFQSVRQYASMLDPKRRCLYISEVLDGGQTPIFRVTCLDAPEEAVTSDSCSGAWSIVLRKVDVQKNGYPINGPIQFGLTNPIVRQLIEALPGSRKCRKYNFSRGGSSKPLPLPEQPTFTPAQLAEEEPNPLVPQCVLANFGLRKKNKKYQQQMLMEAREKEKDKHTSHSRQHSYAANTSSTSFAYSQHNLTLQRGSSRINDRDGNHSDSDSDHSTSSSCSSSSCSSAASNSSNHKRRDRDRGRTRDNRERHMQRLRDTSGSGDDSSTDSDDAHKHSSAFRKRKVSTSPARVRAEHHHNHQHHEEADSDEDDDGDKKKSLNKVNEEYDEQAAKRSKF